MPLIQITNTYRGGVLELVRSCVPEGFDIRTLPENSEDALLAAVEDADYLLASGRVRIDAKILDRAKRLKMIQRTGVGLDSLDLEALRDRGIPLYVNQGVNAESVAEHALLLMLACLRRLPVIDRMVKRGVWEKQEQGLTTRQLAGKTVGIIGLGRIGGRLAELLKPFRANVLYYDRYQMDKTCEESFGLTYAPLETVLRQSDLITLHCPLTAETRNLVCRKTLSQMKDGVILINTARGGLICEADLTEAILSGKVGYAGLDVFALEPVPKDNPLLQMERVITTPHIGGVSYDSFRDMITAAMENIRMFEAGNLEAIRRSGVVL